MVVSGLLNYWDYELQNLDSDKLKKIGPYGEMILKCSSLPNFRFAESFKETIMDNENLELYLKDLFGERRTLTLDFNSADLVKNSNEKPPSSIVSFSKLAYRVRSMMVDQVGDLKYIRTRYTHRTILPKS